MVEKKKASISYVIFQRIVKNIYDNKDRPTTVIPLGALLSNTNLIFR
ncbi:MAG: hypothetical protein IPN76_10675 [Saprospiraceae bacterium]|nr:hypothetical protein [Saprospiraceae bacterium]